MTKCALIVGIPGLDGSYVAEFLLEKDFDVHGIKRRTSLLETARIDHIHAYPDTGNSRCKLREGFLADSLRAHDAGLRQLRAA